MTNVRSHWLLVATMALMTFLAMLGWGAYAYSSSLSATLSKQRGERDGAIANITADREALVTAQAATALGTTTIENGAEAAAERAGSHYRAACGGSGESRHWSSAGGSRRGKREA